MTEKQKMLSGLAYNSRDSQLLEMYHNARAYLQKFNTLNSRDTEGKASLLEELLGGIGQDVWVESPFYCDYGELIFIGSNTFVNANCFFLDNNSIIIGDNCLIGPSVQLYTASHPLQASERIIKNPSQEGKTLYKTFSRPIKIGNNTWIGGNSIILPGVTIGDNTTIGAGSVVSKDIPSDVLAMGNPCEVITSL